MFKSLLKPNILQPILTVVLIGVLAILGFKFFGKDTTNDPSLQEVTRKVTFKEAADGFMNKSYQVYTQGSLIVKSGQQTFSLDPNKKQSTDTSTTASENKYDDLFFYLDKGKVFRIDYTTFGVNASLMVDAKDQIVALDNQSKTYMVYPIPTDLKSKEGLIYTSYREILKNLFPFGALIDQYREGKFNPVDRGDNLYSGKWQHPFFTSNEIVDVIIETDPTNGLFRSFSVAHGFTTVPSSIYFDFRNNNLTNETKAIPSDYKAVTITTPTPTKKP